MTIADQSLANLLDETIGALSSFDYERLLSLEERIILLAKSEVINKDAMSALIQRHSLLKRMLNETQANFALFTRLRSRDENSKWAR